MKKDNISVVINRDDFARVGADAVGKLVLEFKDSGAAAAVLTIMGAALMREFDRQLFEGKKDLESEVEE